MSYAVKPPRLLFLALFVLPLGFLPAGCSDSPPLPGVAVHPPEGFYRFDERLSEAAVQTSPVEAAPEGLTFTFGDSSAQPWVVGLPSSTCRVEDGALIFAAKERDTVTSPDGLGIEGPEIDAVTVEMEAKDLGRVDLLWRTRGANWADEEHRVISILVREPRKRIAYTLQLAGVKAWRYRTSDQIRLRIDGGAEIRVWSIRFITRRSAFAHAGAGTHEFSVGSRLRPCLYAHSPASIKYRIHVPERARFSAGLGLVDPALPTTFGLTVEENGSQTGVLRQVVEKASDWTDVQADLSAFAGRDVDLTLRTECAGKGQIALWSSPILYQARAPATTDSAAQAAPLNVLVYVIDCLRADHLDVYGYGRETAPNIRAFAQTAARFARCYSQDTWTRPSMTSLATGVDSFVHGMKEYGFLIPDKLAMLPEILREAGYTTCAVTENPQTPPDMGQRRAYCYLETPYLRVETGENRLKWCELPGLTYEAASQFLENHHEESFFLYVHTMEPHGIFTSKPSVAAVYDAPEPFRSLWAKGPDPNMMDVYDGCIAHADHNFRRLLDKIEELGLRNNTLVILMADHGEAFGEHDNLFGHTGRPYNELLHIPLFISLPGSIPPGSIVEENTALIDVTPTILDYAGLSPCEQFRGLSLRPLIEGRNREVFAGRVVFANGADWLHSSAAIRGNSKVFEDTDAGKTILFDLARDHAETLDVSSIRPDTFAELKAALDRHRQEGANAAALLRVGETAATTAVIDPQAQEVLDGLAYFGTKGKTQK